MVTADYQYFYTVAVPVVCVVGVVGNVLNLVVLSRSRRLRSVAFIYLRWMTVADLNVVTLWTFYSVLLIARVDLDASLQLTRFYGHVDIYWSNSVICVSNLLVMGLTIDRYLSVCHPLRTKIVHLPRTANIVVVVIYVMSFVINIPYTFNKKTEAKPNSTDYEAVNRPSVTEHPLYVFVWVWGREAVSKFIPILCVVVLNCLILRGHRHKIQNNLSLRSRHNVQDRKKYKKQLRADRRLLVLLSLVSVVFVVCTLPAAIVNIIVHTRTGERSLPLWIAIYGTNLLELINNACNFYLYSIGSSDFRLSFREVFSFCFRSPVTPMASTDDDSQTSGSGQNTVNRVAVDEEGESSADFMRAKGSQKTQVAFNKDQTGFPLCKLSGDSGATASMRDISDEMVLVNSSRVTGLFSKHSPDLESTNTLNYSVGNNSECFEEDNLGYTTPVVEENIEETQFGTRSENNS